MEFPIAIAKVCWIKMPQEGDQEISLRYTAHSARGIETECSSGNLRNQRNEEIRKEDLNVDRKKNTSHDPQYAIN